MENDCFELWFRIKMNHQKIMFDNSSWWILKKKLKSNSFPWHFPLESCHLSHQNEALSVKEKHHKLWKNWKQKSNWRKSLHFYLFYKGFYNWTLFRTNFVECRHIISKTNVHLCNKFTLNLLQFWISMYNNGEKLHFQSHVFVMEEDKFYIYAFHRVDVRNI